MTQAPSAPPNANLQISLHGTQEHILEIVRKLYLGVHYICGASVEGDVAEFGTMTGLTSTLLAR